MLYHQTTSLAHQTQTMELDVHNIPPRTGGMSSNLLATQTPSAVIMYIRKVGRERNGRERGIEKIGKTIIRRMTWIGNDSNSET